MTSGSLLIDDRAFALFQAMMHKLAGVRLSPAKKAMVSGRLAKRLQACGARSFEEYFHLIHDARHADEMQRALDLLTTHETYFFREPAHFDLLAGELLAGARGDRPVAGRAPGRSQAGPHPLGGSADVPVGRGAPFRVWSAACSTGEEAYSIAMVLMDRLGAQAAWEVVGTDISADAVARARAGVYATARIDALPGEYLRRFCLKGIGSRAGTLLVDRSLRERVSFAQANLNDSLATLGTFDVVFLRNVMIYFDAATKARVVQRVAERIVDGGWLLVGHSESLNGVAGALRLIRPTVYRKP